MHWDWGERKGVGEKEKMKRGGRTSMYTDGFRNRRCKGLGGERMGSGRERERIKHKDIY